MDFLAVCIYCMGIGLIGLFIVAGIIAALYVLLGILALIAASIVVAFVRIFKFIFGKQEA